MKKNVFALFGFVVLLTACQWMPMKQIGGSTPAKHISANNTAIIPVQANVDWWMPRQEAVIKQVKQGNAQLIFIGDSITHGWEIPGNIDIWNYYFGAWHPINMGFSADRTQHVLWRLDHGSLDGISPKAAVIMIGTNNSNGEDNTVEEIAEGITAIVDRIRTKSPKTRILLLAIFPRNEKPDAQREKNNQVNKLISKLADNKKVFFLDINQNFLNPDQTLSKEIMPDFLHPNRVGYQIWAISIKDKLNELMK